MQTFYATVNQMIVMFIFLALGFFLTKKKIVPENSSSVLSKLETNLFLPALMFSTFCRYCTVQNFQDKSIYILYGLATILASIAIGHFLAKPFSKDPYIRRLYAYGFASANFGFLGNAVVLGVFGESILFDHMMFTLPLNVYSYSFGAPSLIPDNAGKKLSLKALLNPIFISMGLGALFGMLNIQLPKCLDTAVSYAGGCMTPVAMLLTGMVVGQHDIKALAKNGRVYIASVLRLIVIPTVFILILKVLNTDADIIRAVICATAMPMGLSTVVFPAAYGGDTTPGASMALISQLMALITIPLMFLIFL